MANVKKRRGNWRRAWKKHKQELLIWLVGVAVYMIFMRNVEHSRGTYLVLAVIFFLPPITVGRIIWTAMMKSDEDA
jgi:hypothetical protein